MTLALKAKKVPMNAYCQTIVLAGSIVGAANLSVKNVVVAQKDKKRKKVPRRPIIAEWWLLIALREDCVGFCNNWQTIIPNEAAKR